MVAVAEAAAGSPPFLGVSLERRAGSPVAVCHWERCSVLRDRRRPRDEGRRKSLSPDLENCTVLANYKHLSPSRYEGHMVDALAPGVDEGRGRLR
jgi:hypothetical protein